MAHDIVTSTLSPEYFIAGKGLESDHLQLRAMWLAAQAAVGPGALRGLGFVFANNPSNVRAQLSYRSLYSLLKLPILFALAGAFLFGLLGYIDIRGITPELNGTITDPRSFITVWGIHWGTYTGGFVGICVSVVSIVRRRKAQTHTSSRAASQ
jgi:hypothetical protein